MPRRQNWTAAVSRETVKPLQFEDFGKSGEMPLFSDSARFSERPFGRIQPECRYSDAFIAYWLYDWRWHEWEGLWYLTAPKSVPDWYPFNSDPPTDNRRVPFREHRAWMNGSYSIYSTGVPAYTAELQWAWQAANLCGELYHDQFRSLLHSMTTYHFEWVLTPMQSPPVACSLLCQIILCVLTTNAERKINGIFDRPILKPARR